MSISKFIFSKILRWHWVDPLPDCPRCIILAAPHTSIWDFVVGFFYYMSFGQKLHVMIKKEAFFFPLGSLLRALGAFPIDRKNSKGTMQRLMKEMDESEKYQLCICPEGTRKAVHKWKTGYHKIATHCNVPVYLAYLDYATKTIGVRPEPVPITDNAREDTDRIQAIYESMNLTGLHKDGYATK